MIGLSADDLIRRGFSNAYWRDAAGQQHGQGPLRPDYNPYDPAIASDNEERARRYHLRYGDVPVIGIAGATDNFHPEGALVEIREAVLPRAMFNAWSAGWFESTFGIPKGAGNGWPTDTERDDFAFCFLPMRPGFLDTYRSAPGDLDQPVRPEEASEIPAALAHSHHLNRFKLWTFPEIGLEGWARFVAAHVVPVLRAQVEKTGYDQASADRGEEMQVPATIFLEMFAAWQQQAQAKA